jgi:hypothetical protein
MPSRSERLSRTNRNRPPVVTDQMCSIRSFHWVLEAPVGVGRDRLDDFQLGDVDELDGMLAVDRPAEVSEVHLPSV